MSPAGPLGVAGTELVCLVDGVQLLDLLLTQLDERQVGGDTLGGDRLGDDCEGGTRSGHWSKR